MLYGLQFIQACCLFACLPLRGSPSLGLLEVPQVATWELFQFTSTSMAGREAGSPGELIAGHVDQAKSQRAAGEVAAVISFQSTLSSAETRPAPRLVALHLVFVFSTPL